MMIRDFYKKHIASRIFIKFICIYALVLSITILISGKLIVKNYTDKVEHEAILNQNELLEKMVVVVDEKYTKVRNVMLKLYDPTYPTHFMTWYKEDSEKAKKAIEKDLNNICKWDEDILDFILFNNEGDIISASERSVSPSYNFIEQRSKINPDVAMYIEPQSPPYIIGFKHWVNSISGPLFDIEPFPNRILKGQYIINISLDGFSNAFNQYSREGLSDLYILNKQGEILYSNRSGQIGELFPLYPVMSEDAYDSVFINEDIIMSYTYLSRFDISIATTTPKSKLLHQLKVFYKQMYSIIATYILISFFMAILVSQLFASKIKVLVHSMKRLKNGDFQTRIPTKGNDELAVLGDNFNDMCDRLNTYINKVYVEEVKAKNAELASLQSKINPHFLYNTLELVRIKANANEDYEVEEMISLLGKIFRWNIKGKGRVVRIEDEINYIRGYLELQKMCCGNMLVVDIDVPEAILRLGMPKLLLQPLVENALYHGLFPKSRSGHIQVKGALVDNMLEFTVSDDGVGIDEAKLNQLQEALYGDGSWNNEESMGVMNVHQRIKLNFGETYGLTINSAKDQGTDIKIYIPKLSLKEMEEHVLSHDCR